MTRLLSAASAAVAALALVSGASTASAQTYGFTNPGEQIIASGTLVQDALNPGGPSLATTCDVEFYGAVSSNGLSLILASAQTLNASGPLDCTDGIDFPIVITAVDEDTVDLDSFIVSIRGIPCIEDNYQLDYVSNEILFDGGWFGFPAVCSFQGPLSVTSDPGGDPVLIVES